MRYEWLTQKQHEQLIIFFNGWGMDKTSIAHLQQNNDTFDCLHFFDYCDITLPPIDFINDFTKYKQIYLIAWSMGIFVSSCLPLSYSKKIAFCGTGNPIDAKEGIHPKIYHLTLQNFNDNTRQVFSKKIGFTMNSTRNTKSLQKELANILNYDLPKNTPFNTAFIAEKDEIFPPNNQKYYWQNHADQIYFLNCKHYAFNLFSSWQEILNFKEEL